MLNSYTSTPQFDISLPQANFFFYSLHGSQWMKIFSIRRISKPRKALLILCVPVVGDFNITMGKPFGIIIIDLTGDSKNVISILTVRLRYYQ